ncbi:MAG: CbtA family protein, partial [Acidimicrobiia bacterium]
VDAPANLIWHFRLDSLAGNALMWLVIGITFGWLGDRAIARDTVRPNAAESMSAA